MTNTQTFASKLTVAFVAAAMIVSVFAPAAQAQTSEDLQQMINDLLTQVAALQSQVGQESSDVASGVCPYTWTRDLNMGSEGADVMKLQQFLNADLDTRVSATGAGSMGMETMYYGPATAAAVSKMQVKYRAQVLSPANLVNPTGFFGPSSRSAANGLCVAAPVMDNNDDDEATEEDEDMEEDDDNGSMTLGGEASLDTMEIDSASDDEIEEGVEDAEVAEVTVEFTDGDAEISRLDIKFAKGSADASDAFDTISLWIDGDKVAEEDANDEDDYQNDEQTMRFSGLDITVMEDEELEIIVAVSTQDNLDASELGSWSVSVESMRFFDADGVATTEDSGLDFTVAETFSIEVEGVDDEINVKTSSNDPDATTLQVEDDSKSDWYNVFVFDLDTDDSENDIEFESMEVSVTVSSSTFDAIVDDVELVIDGVTIDDIDTYTDGPTVVLVFDIDGDVTIDAGDRVEAQLMLRFKSLDAGNEGITVQGLVTGPNTAAIDAEGADDITGSSLSGAATGDAHTLRTTGIDTTLTDDSAVVTTGDNAGDDYATYELEVEVTAFEQDVFIDVDQATSIVFALEDGAGSSSVAGSRSVVLTSSADENSGYFEINEGETETITLTVTYTPGVANTASRLVLTSVAFAETASAPTQTQTTLPKTDYRTSVVTIVN